MKPKRNIVTPYLTFLFVIVSLSGILMFFHIFDEYTSVVHEILGLAFVLFSVLHIILNWKSLKSHFMKKAFIISGIIILILSVVFIVVDKISVHHEEIMIERIVKAPIDESFKVLNLNYSDVEKILSENGIVIGNSKTIEDIASANNKTAKDIIEFIIVEP
ncbi:MAG TPA: hypothetical protein DIT04_07340 [Dysgonomonas sp.]|nr:hypothetical protein [Dysgonomonas sp.]